MKAPAQTLREQYETSWTPAQREAWQNLGAFVRRINIRYAEQIKQLRGGR